MAKKSEEKEVLDILMKSPFLLQSIFENEKSLSNQSEYNRRYFFGTVTQEEFDKVKAYVEKCMSQK